MITEKLIVVAHKDVLVKTYADCIKIVQVKVILRGNRRYITFDPHKVITIVPEGDMQDYRDLSRPDVDKTVRWLASQIFFGRAANMTGYGVV